MVAEMNNEMKVMCSHHGMASLKELKAKFHPDNRNEHPKDQIERLASILKYQGIRWPVKISKRSGYITAGHGRVLAAQLNKWKEFPVDYQDYESEEQEYADLQADNAIASWAELDISGINMDLERLGPDFNIDMLGIKGFVMEPAEKFEPQSDEDAVPEHVEPRTELGDVYTLGRHRLLCGDSTSIDAVDKLMAGAKADMVFTDPPYGINLQTDYNDMKSEKTSFKSRNTNKFRAIANDDKDFDPGMIFGAFGYVEDIFLWGANYYAERLLDKNKGSWIVWDKRTTEALDRMYGSCFELCWSRSKHKQDIARITWAGCAGHVKSTDGERKVHPTQKPVKLAEWFFDKWGKDKLKIVDLFGGSGSTLIACEKTNRSCFMMELDPHYCDVIVARWEKYTGKTASLITPEAERG